MNQYDSKIFINDVTGTIYSRWPTRQMLSVNEKSKSNKCKKKVCFYIARYPVHHGENENAQILKRSQGGIRSLLIYFPHYWHNQVFGSKSITDFFRSAYA